MADFLEVTLECNGMVLRLGRSNAGEKREFGITKITGLESSDLVVDFADNALVDGSTTEGKRIDKRPIHIEATLRGDQNNDANRQRIIKFFNPKYTGKLTAIRGCVKRNIEYELEGWSFVGEGNVFDQLSFVADLICPDPLMKNVDNFGRNMADVSRHIAFPWRVMKSTAGIPAENKTLILSGQITGYKTFRKEVYLPNDGDVPTSVQIKFIAKRGPCTSPKITLLSTGQFVRVMTEMRRGDELLIDTAKHHRVIELNGENAYQKIDRYSKAFSLAVGSNFLEYDADENYTNLDVMLYYTPRYLGV